MSPTVEEAAFASHPVKFGCKWYPHYSPGMTVAKINLALIFVSLAVLGACGSPGEPLPPSLELARPVSDLRALRKGNTVILTWTAPTSTTDRHNIRHPGPTEICRASGRLQQCGEPIAMLPPTNNHDQDVSRTYTDTLRSFSLDPDAKFVYAIEVQNSYGKSAGPSNQVQVPAAPTLPAPSDLKAQLSGDGVHLSWAPATDVPQSPGVLFIYRLYRQETGTNAQAVAGEVPLRADSAPSFVDNSIEWGKTYEYRIRIVTFIQQSQGTTQQVQGDESQAVTILAQDVFPPATPSGLQAVSSGPGQKRFIDLVWAPDTDADIAGYNVYRRRENEQPVKINSDLVKTPRFADPGVQPGTKYFYSVTAVDLRGNESGRSEETSETVPKD